MTKLEPKTEGNYLYNENAQSIGTVVYLGINADETEWVEITEAEKERLEAEWEAEVNGYGN